MPQPRPYRGRRFPLATPHLSLLGATPLRSILGIAAALAVLATCDIASARRNGYFGNCAQCHMGGPGAQVSVMMTPDQFNLGDTVRIAVTVSGSAINVGGFYLTTAGKGVLTPVGGDSRSSGTQATHTSPKNASGGSVTFEVDWKAPSDPFALHLSAYGVAANGSNTPLGDSAAMPIVNIDRLVGCTGAMYFRDFDGDGYGTSLVPPILECSAPAGYVDKGGDCSEEDPAINPGAVETCNNVDDDCDGEIDDNAAPTCGVGLCRRYAEYCSATAPCFPGTPSPEACNGLDDDCDGKVDQGSLCMGGLVCQGAECKTLDAALASDPTFVPDEGTDPTTVSMSGMGGMAGSNSSNAGGPVVSAGGSPSGVGGLGAGAGGGATSLSAGTGGTPIGGTPSVSNAAGSGGMAVPSASAAPSASCSFAVGRAPISLAVFAGFSLLFFALRTRQRRDHR
ncbi:MAG TPA: putative metal-binding motif-containing protein [Polyangiaceae bacterium]|nr:putative metal-binding motif-containing protein [Polyangiaceae bacterium]